MKHLAVTTETAARAVELQELLDANADTIVGLALDVLGLAIEAHTGKAAAAPVMLTDTDAMAAIRLVREHGMRYAAIAATGDRAARTLDGVESGDGDE